MDETAKKSVESCSRCFICSSVSLKNNKIFIFIAGVIRSSLSVGVSHYSENSDLFVCRDKCYQHLIKFQRASDKVNQLKREIKEVFNTRTKQRVKRLLQSDEEKILFGEEGARNTVTPPGKATKSLRFSDTTCTSSGDAAALATPIYHGRTPLVSCLSPIQGHPYSLVLRAFQNSQLNCSGPRLTSTPISSNHISTYDSSQVRVSIKYPSKIINKHLSTVYQPIGKALSHGIPSQIARAIMKCQPLRQHVTQQVLKIVSKEVTVLC